MSKEVQLSLLKDLGTFWYSDASVPQLFERKIVDEFIETYAENVPNSDSLKNFKTEIGGYFSDSTIKRESETCSKLIEPLLELLGYSEKESGRKTWLFDEQRSFHEDDQRYIPDYSLFTNREVQKRANEVESNTYYNYVDLIIEAKHIGKDLLSKSKIDRDLDDRTNDFTATLSPLSQIRRYIRATETEFGIVTNGNDWILVSKNSRNYLSTYHTNLAPEKSPRTTKQNLLTHTSTKR